jgi:hypothetical protein
MNPGWWRLKAKPKERSDCIHCLLPLPLFFSAFLAQKSHVKPQTPQKSPFKTNKQPKINHLQAKK